MIVLRMALRMMMGMVWMMIHYLTGTWVSFFNLHCTFTYCSAKVLMWFSISAIALKGWLIRQQVWKVGTCNENQDSGILCWLIPVLLQLSLLDTCTSLHCLVHCNKNKISSCCKNLPWAIFVSVFKVDDLIPTRCASIWYHWCIVDRSVISMNWFKCVKSWQQLYVGICVMNTFLLDCLIWFYVFVLWHMPLTLTSCMLSF